MIEDCNHSLARPVALFWDKLEIKDTSPGNFISWLENLSSNISNLKAEVRLCTLCNEWFIGEKVEEYMSWFWRNAFDDLQANDIRFVVSEPDCSHKQFKLKFEYLYHGRRYVYGNDTTCDLAVNLTTVHECTECGAFLFGDGTISQRPEERGDWEGYYDLYLAPPEMYEYVLRYHKVPEEEWKKEPITKTDGGWYMPGD